MIKNLTKQKIAIATAMKLAFITAQAQTADGTVVITGQVNANTCKVNISDASGVSPTNNGVRSVELGTVSPTGTFSAGQLLGTKQNITFSLTASSGSGACTFAAGTTGWNMALRTIQTDPSLPVRVRLEGDSAQGQVLQLEQRGLVIYEQTLNDGTFRIREIPPLNDRSPLTVRLKSPSQEDQQTVLPVQPNQRRDLYAKRPELLALAPSALPKPFMVPLPNTKLEEDIEFDSDFLRGKAFRNLSPLDIKRLGSVRPGNVDVDIFRNDRMVGKSTVRFTEPPDGGNARACITPVQFQQLGVKPNFISPQGMQLMKTAAPSTSAANGKPDSDCLYIDQWVTGASSTYDTNELRLDITIAQAFLTKQNRQSVPPEMLTRGENAGFINYIGSMSFSSLFSRFSINGNNNNGTANIPSLWPRLAWASTLTEPPTPTAAPASKA